MVMALADVPNKLIAAMAIRLRNKAMDNLLSCEAFTKHSAIRMRNGPGGLV
jgi:hypothetical protein